MPVPEAGHLMGFLAHSVDDLAFGCGTCPLNKPEPRNFSMANGFQEYFSGVHECAVITQKRTLLG